MVSRTMKAVKEETMETVSIPAFDPMDTRLTIIENDGDLLALVAAVHQTGNTYNALAQKAVISSLHMLSKHGRAEALNKLFDGFQNAYKSALKQFIRKHCGDDIEKDGQAGREYWLGHTQADGWFINKETGPNGMKGRSKAPLARKEWTDAPAQFLGLKFYEEKVDRPDPNFNDEWFLASLDRLIKSASKDDAHVSAKIIDFVREARKNIEQIVPPKAA